MKKLHPTKEKIIKETLRLFAEDGYEETTMAHIMEATDLSKGALYHHFKSKNDIADSAIAQISEQMKTEFEAILKKDLSALEKLTEIISVKQEVFAQQKQAFINIFNSSKSGPLKQKMQAASCQNFVPIMTSIIAQGQKEGSFSSAEDPQITAYLMFNIQKSLQSVPPKIAQDPEQTKSFMRAGTRLVCQTLGIDPHFFDTFCA